MKNQETLKLEKIGGYVYLTYVNKATGESEYIGFKSEKSARKYAALGNYTISE